MSTDSPATSCRHAYYACVWDPCEEHWHPVDVFYCPKDACKFADSKMRSNARSSRPMQFWHVENMTGTVLWGAVSVIQSATGAGAPDRAC